jgi:hypothetical protein
MSLKDKPQMAVVLNAAEKKTAPEPAVTSDLPAEKQAIGGT